MSHQLPRRAVLSALGAGLSTALLGGCTSTAPLPVPADGGSPSPAPAPSATVTAATGPVLVPGAPTRVVALDTAELDSAITLGITPVGATRAPLNSTFPDYWPASWLDGIAYAGTIGSPDTNAISILQPQLILGNETRDAAHYEALSRIAPTVLTRTTGYPWKDNFQLHAHALGRQAQAAVTVAAYGRHVSQTVQAISAAGSGGKKISIVRFVQGAPIRLYGRQSFIGTLLADLQLGRPDAQNVDQSEVEVTPDQLSKADGDYLFYASYGDPSTVPGSAAWQSLGAVKAHRAFEVDDELWFQGIGYTGANLILAELQRFLGG